MQRSSNGRTVAAGRSGTRSLPGRTGNGKKALHPQGENVARGRLRRVHHQVPHRLLLPPKRVENILSNDPTENRGRRWEFVRRRRC